MYYYEFSTLLDINHVLNPSIICYEIIIFNEVQTLICM